MSLLFNRLKVFFFNFDLIVFFLVVILNLLYAFSVLTIGGYDGSDDLSDVWENKEATKSWHASKKLSINRSYCLAHVIPSDSKIDPI